MRARAVYARARHGPTQRRGAHRRRPAGRRRRVHAAHVTRHRSPALRFAYGIAGADAEDAVQDAFVKAFRNLDRFRPGAAFKPWLFTIVANEARDRRRSMSRRGTSSCACVSSLGRSASRPTKSRSQREQRQHLLDAVAALSGSLPRGRRAALLRRAQRKRERRGHVVSVGDREVPLVASARSPAGQPRRGGDPVINLEHTLTDLAEHLDHPTGEQLVDDVRERLAPHPPRAGRRPSRTRSWLAVAAVFLLVLATVIAVAPARHTIADWLGLGAVKIRRIRGAAAHERPRRARRSPGARVRAPNAARRRAYRAARTVMEFPITLPRDPARGSALRRSRWMCVCPVGSSP